MEADGAAFTICHFGVVGDELLDGFEDNAELIELQVVFAIRSRNP